MLWAGFKVEWNGAQELWVIGQLPVNPKTPNMKDIINSKLKKRGI